MWQPPEQPNYSDEVRAVRTGPAPFDRMANVKELPRDEQALEEELALAFTPLHKLCLGLAVGVALAAVVALATVVHLLRSPDEPFPLVLLAQYMPGYSVSWAGALIGAAWGFFSGFVIGWFFAFARNVVMAVAKVVLRAKAELVASRGFLDHI